MIRHLTKFKAGFKVRGKDAVSRRMNLQFHLQCIILGTMWCSWHQCTLCSVHCALATQCVVYTACTILRNDGSLQFSRVLCTIVDTINVSMLYSTTNGTMVQYPRVLCTSFDTSTLHFNALSHKPMVQCPRVLCSAPFQLLSDCAILQD